MDAPERTLLVVDDNPANRDLLSRRLERKGFRVITAEDGRRALDILATSKVDLVLLDVMMPGLSGLEVLRKLRETQPPSLLPVVMVTAKTESEDVVEALELGANDYVTKPIDFPVVLARVKAQLRMRPTRNVDPAEPQSPAQVGPGSVLAGRYRIESRIGTGSFGAVFKARHLELQGEVAVKVLGTSIATEPDALGRFRREGISACRVRHPNAVAVLDFGVTAAGIAYLVMENLDGRSLDQEMQVMGRLGPARCARVLIPVCGALAEAHRAGIVHRDIKPSNIFLHRQAGREMPKVLDFGIARLAGDAALQGSLTVDGSLLGTPAYMAPERFSSQPYDGKADVYSVGITLYQMLAGQLPFVAPHRDPLAMAMMQRNDPPPPLHTLDPPVPPAMEAVVLRTLCKDPAERPSAEELARLLAQASGLPARTPAPAVAAGGSPAGTLTPPTPASQAAQADTPRGKPAGDEAADRTPPGRAGS
jgi:DNA-binding response OmpR family regulator